MTSKVYVEILQQLYRIIEEDGLSAGNKIPSERELAERLNAGRSSVREALRSLEFLGIIETRRGEGTYLKEFGDHQLIGLLGMFILQEKKAKEDLAETKWLIEEICLLLACKRRTEEHVQQLEQLLTKPLDYETFFQWVVKAANNYLLERIWRVVNDFYQSQHGTISLPHVFYEQMAQSFRPRDWTTIRTIFSEHRCVD
ncbi:FadR/GntR family transcriptional regulator [Anoxybacteroides amylolyticum]|uniref:Bacterial regulatory s, gntR family protein n=1 Tax=Anoxybacteroides amylolyticum TaxID=294699 RepID=A0A160F6G4_9BACL|nr:GntR family transcriptional regulator [Anoxybacillus amylolyticus]ANB62197.1 bacterial regulatory s, gntR family protein [Anoxybacillus amylolyticus]